MVSILGAGAIGQLLAHKLTDASVDCQLIVRDKANCSENWQLIHANRVFEKNFKLTDIKDQNVLSTIAITVKAPQLEVALQNIKHRIDNTTQIILLQNGMGHEQIAKQFVSEDKIFFASNTHGAFKQDKQIVHYAGKGSIHFGQLKTSSRIPTWFKDFDQADLDTDWSDDIKTILFRKLFVNAVINPLTALYQCRNGDLLQDSKKLRLLALIEENSRFAQSINLSFESNLKELVLNVIEKTANNYNSMYQDVNAGVETEINAINGYLLDQMTLHGFDAPHNWQLWSDFHISFPPLKQIAQARAKSFDALQYQVTQQAGTERPFTGTYNQHSETGDYLCACCDSVLFDNKGKFDSHCGWPSFDQAKNNKAIAYREDLSHGMQRTEILCAQCGSHLGHVFNDGPTDTGVRYCVNSVSLNFSQRD